MQTPEQDLTIIKAHKAAITKAINWLLSFSRPESAGLDRVTVTTEIVVSNDLATDT